jgi:hypothetical protein
VGGIAGYASGTAIDQSYATGSIIGSSEVGGLAGIGYGIAINDSYSRSDVTGSGESIGGIVGSSQFTSMDRTYSTGDITSTDSSYVGGIVGYFNLDNGGMGVKDSFASGTMSGDVAGGLVGAYSFATGPVMENGYWNHTSSDPTELPCYNYESSGYLTGDNNCTKINNNQAYFKSSNNGPMNTWDFDTVWAQYSNVNDGFPCLSWDSQCVDDGMNSDSNSVTFVSPATSKSIKLELSEGCDFEALFKNEGYSNGPQDVAYQYPNGLVGFNANCGAPGFTTTVTQYYYGVKPESMIARKYNPNTKTYFSINDAVIQEVSLDNQVVTKVSFQVTDGSERDADGVVDGLISDPAGLAQAVVGVPNTGFGRR